MRNTPKKTQTAAEFIDQEMEEYAKTAEALKVLNTAFEIEKLNLAGQYTPQITILETQKELTFEKISDFANENKIFLFGEKRSYDTKYGNFGFRLGHPRFSLAVKSTWDTVLKTLKEFLPQYVKVTEAPSKTKMMADIKLPALMQLLPALVVSVVQDDNFFIDVK